MNMRSDPARRPYHIQVACRCHVGKTRERNEDSCFTFYSEAAGFEAPPIFGLFVVADGMGGHANGHHASRLAARVVAGNVLEQIYKPLIQQNGAAQAPVQEVLQQAYEAANTSLAERGTEGEMGTTLTTALIMGTRLFLAHVGDSRAYLLEEGELQQLTTDHSVVQAMQDAGEISPEEAAFHPERNLLYRALFGAELEGVDLATQTLPMTGSMLLCSDGLWGLVPGPRLHEIVNGDEPPGVRADQLLDEALDAGGHDNITIILVDFAA
jgi:serine/threonine protein phosphatase PrpC